MKVTVLTIFINIVLCATGLTRNAATGVCKCSVNCATAATCTENSADNSHSCTCDTGYEPDALLTTSTDYYCTGKAAPTLLHKCESYSGILYTFDAGHWTLIVVDNEVNVSLNHISILHLEHASRKHAPL